MLALFRLACSVRVESVSWFLRRPSARVAAAGRENEHAWAQAAHELKQLRVNTATGLERLHASSAQAPVKSRWDKAGVIIQAAVALAVIVPLVALIVSINQFNEQQKNNESAALQQQRSNTAAALDQQRQATLSGYLDDMSVLVLQYNEGYSGHPVEVKANYR